MDFLTTDPKSRSWCSDRQDAPSNCLAGRHEMIIRHIRGHCGNVKVWTGARAALFDEDLVWIIRNSSRCLRPFHTRLLPVSSRYARPRDERTPTNYL